MKIKTFITLVLSVLITFSGITIAEAAQTVQVTLPDFDVTLNGQKIDNNTRQYPLIVYKDITYFPMTYYDSRFLGLYTQWDAKKGLGVYTYDGVSAYHIDATGTKNKKRDFAQVAQGPIEVNSVYIDNKAEKYPLLLFRDVTYFPLTWRFAVNEFGWTYRFDNACGLTIERENVKTESVLLSDGRTSKEINTGFDFAIDSQYLYYQGKNGEIYQRPLSAISDSAKRKTVAQIPYEDDYFKGYPFTALYEENGDVYYQYHSGGATMGGNYLYKISGNQNAQLILKRTNDAYTGFDGFGIRTFGPAVGSTGTGMMYVDENGTMKLLGPEQYKYKVQADSYDAARMRIYVTTQNYNDSALCELDLKTGELNKLSDSAHENYDVTEDAIYYQALQKLFVLDLNTKEERVVATSSDFIYQYTATDKGVFFASPEHQNALSFWNKDTGTTTLINSEFAVTKLYSQNGYVVVNFEEKPDNQHRLLVFDENGNQVFSSMDVADKAVINNNGVMIYRLDGTSQLVKVTLE